tara:strand:- start:389 stop:790 length:402 start_codon:yes stop_codon:yes gene_type:complete
MATAQEEKNSVGRPRIDAWSIQNKCCKSCGTSDRADRNSRHHAQGYCFRCYHREWAGSQPTLINRGKIKDSQDALERAFKGELRALREMYLSYTSNEGTTAVAQLIGKVEAARHSVAGAKRDLATLKKEAKNG